MHLSLLVFLMLLCNCRRFTTCMWVENIVNINAVFLDVHKHNENNLHTSFITESRSGLPYHHFSLRSVAHQRPSPEVVLRRAVFPHLHSGCDGLTPTERLGRLFLLWLQNISGFFKSQLHVETPQCNLTPSYSVSNQRAISHTRVTVKISF